MEGVDLLIKQSNQLLEEATKIALKEIERIARKELIQHEYLDEFMMAMGSYVFITKEKKYNDTSHKCKELDDFIDEYDEALSLTGEAIRFSATGEVITDW